MTNTSDQHDQQSEMSLFSEDVSYHQRSSWVVAAWQWSCPACTQSVCGGGPFSGRYPESLGSYSQNTHCLLSRKAHETWLKHCTLNKPWLLANTHSPTHSPTNRKLHIQAQKALSELRRTAEQTRGGGVSKHLCRSCDRTKANGKRGSGSTAHLAKLNPMSVWTLVNFPLLWREI